MAGYLIDTAKGETPESVARQRAVAEALAQASLGRAPQNVGEGLTAVGQALAYRAMMRRAQEAEAAGQASLNAPWDKALAALFPPGGGDTGTPDLGTSPTPPAAPSISSYGSSGIGAYGQDGMQPAAPPAAAAAPSADHAAFVAKMTPLALEVSKRTGLDPRLIIAQAAQETGWGASAPGNNFFGIKSHGQPGGQTLATSEYGPGGKYTTADSFRTYADPAASGTDYANFLKTNSRYGPMLQAQGLDAQVAALSKSGYATDPNYATSVGGIARGLQVPGQPPGGVQMVASALANKGQPVPPVQVASLDPMAGLSSITGGPRIPPEATAPAGPPPVQVAGAGGADAMTLAPPPYPGPLPTQGAVPPGPATGTAIGRLPTQTAPAAAAPGGPQVGQSISPEALQSAVAIMKSPWANPSQRAFAQSIIENYQKQRDPAYILQQKAAALDYEQKLHPPTSYGFTNIPGVGLVATDPRGGTAKTVLQAPPGARPLSAQEAQQYPGAAWIDDQGQPHWPPQGTTITNNLGPTGIDYGTPGAGLTWKRDQAGKVVTDERGAPIAIPFQGGKPYADAQAAAAAAEAAKTQKTAKGTIQLQDVNRALDLIDKDSFWTTGWAGQQLKDLGGSPANALQGLLGPLESFATLDALQGLRDQSPTGASGLGQLSNREGILLAQTKGDIQQSRNADQLKTNLQRFNNIIIDMVYGTAEERAGLLAAGKITPELNADIQSHYYQLPFDEFGKPVAPQTTIKLPDGSTVRQVR